MGRNDLVLSRFFGNKNLSFDRRRQRLSRTLRLNGVEQLENRSLLAAVIGDGGGHSKPVIPATEDYVPNHVLVKLRAGVTDASASQLKSELGAETIKSFSDLGIQVWSLPMPMGPLTTLDSQSVVRNAIDQHWNDDRLQ